MNMDLLIALISSVVSFIAFRLLFFFLGKILNVEVPDLVGMILGLIIIAALFVKKDFFFAGNPLVTGITIGVILSLLWSVKGTVFMGEILGVVISLRFLVWCITLTAGIYWDDMILGLWNKYITYGIPQAKPFLLSAVIILFILGTVLTLFPEFYIRNVMKSSGFTLNKSVSTTRKVFTQIIGLIIVFVCSNLFSEVSLFICRIFS